MALRGERVGEAYVRIHADGGTLNQEIRDLFDDQNDAYDDAGRRNSRAYNEAFADEMERAPNQTRLRKALTDSLAKGDFLEQEFFQSRNWKNFRAGMINEFGEAGRLAGDRLENELLQGMTFEDLDARLGNITRDVVRAERDILKEQKNIDNERLSFHKDMLAAYAENERRTQNLGKLMDTALAMDRKRTITQLKEEYTDLTALVNRMNKGEEETRHNRRDLINQLRTLSDGMHRYGLVNAEVNDTLGDNDRLLRTMNPTLNRHRAGINSLAESIGSAFGKGSRNDFINFIGSMASGLVRVGNIVPTIAGGLTDLARTFRFDGLGAGFAQLGGGILKVGAAMAGLFVLVGPLLSIFSLLGGVVVALAGSIGFALVGAVGALAGALLPLIAGFGVLTLAIQAVDWKTLEDDLAPLSDAFDRLQNAAVDTVFSNIGTQAKRLSPVLDGLIPLVRGIGDEISNLGDFFIDALRSPGFREFRDSMEDFLPTAVGQLGRSLGNALGGAAGILQGLIPITSEFLGWLEKITGEFADWANSAQGQREIVSFFEDASASVKDFGAFLESVGALLATFLDQGRATGDSLFRSMSDAIDGWVQKLQANPDILSDWFDSAQKFGEALGEVLIGLGRIFDSLDSGASRTAVVAIFTALGAALETLGSVLEAVGPQMAGFLVVVGGLLKIGGSLGRTAGGITALTGALRGLGTAGTAAGAGGTAAATGLGALGPAIAAAVGGGLLINYAKNLGEADLKTREVTRGLQELARTGSTDTFNNLGRGAKTLGDALHGVVLMDGGSPYADEVKKLDAALAGMDTETARKAFLNIVDQGRAAGLTLSEVTALFPKYKAAETDWATAQSRDLIKSMSNWILLTGAMRSLPKDVATRITTPGMIESLSDVRSLQIMYDLTPRQLVTTLAASGTAETIGQVRSAIKMFNLTPKQVTTLLKLNGQVESVADVRRYAKALGLTPKQVSTLLKATDGYSKQVHAGERVMTRFDRLRPTPQLKADNKDALNKTAAAAAKLHAVDRQKTNPNITADNSAAISRANNVATRLGEVGRMNPRPTIGATDNASGVINSVQSAINRLEGKTVVIRTQHIEERLGVPRTAQGGIFDGIPGIGQIRRIAEAGAEAVVPLERPLSQVDPAVRWLSAIAQGKIPALASGGVVGSGKTVNVGGITVVSPNADPRAVAAEAINRLATSGY